MVIVLPAPTAVVSSVFRGVGVIPIVLIPRSAAMANVKHLVPRMQRVSQDISVSRGFALGDVEAVVSVLRG